MHAVIAVNHEKFNCRLKNLKRILNLATIGRGFSCNNLHSNGYLSLLFGDFFQRHNLPCFFLWVSCLEFRLLSEVVCFCLSSSSSKNVIFGYQAALPLSLLCTRYLCISFFSLYFFKAYIFIYVFFLSFILSVLKWALFCKFTSIAKPSWCNLIYWFISQRDNWRVSDT